MVQLPFTDRAEAGRVLTEELLAEGLSADGVILALVRGGVPVAFEIATRLDRPLDVIVVRKLGVPWQPELAMGAIAGTARFLDDNLIGELGVSDDEVDEIVGLELAEMRRREDLYRSCGTAVDPEGRTAILVDDGLATGSTMVAAVRHARNLKAARVVVAVPVGSRDACQRLRREADDVVCPATPEPFESVGKWYRDFSQVGDLEVCALLTRFRLREARRQ
jgi:putative phosphoribosyl transferase